MAFEDACKGTTGPDHPDNGNGDNGACVQQPGGNYCPEKSDNSCNPYQLTLNNDACLVDGYINETLNIAGADLNVHKLLGVHEQCKIVDTTGNGTPLSNGNAPGFPSSNAFDVFITEWRSVQSGDGVLASAYLGYDFGVIKTPDGSRRMYGIDTSIRKHITAIAIKQSANAQNRATRARIERSSDGVKWYGVALIDLPDNDCLNTILFHDSVLMRYWRIRPVTFNGGSIDYWGIQALQLFHNYLATDDYNIQDKIYLENRDRDYAEDSILLKGSYDLIDVNTELSKFGIELPAQSIYLQIGFSACVAALGRPLIIGDIIEIPSEMQYSAEMRQIKKWMEVTDVAWSTEGYTPNWQPTLLRVVLQPAYASQETQDLFGDLAENDVEDGLGLVDKGDGRHPNFQDYSDITQEIMEQAKDMVPEAGEEFSSTVREWEDEEVQAAADQGVPNLNRIGLNRAGLFGEDAMPPNQAPFTEGTELPASPSHGDYHRLTYEGLSKDVPARLFRYSETKGRWLFLEKDRRAEFDPKRPRLQEFMEAKGRVAHTEIVFEDPKKCEDETE